MVKKLSELKVGETGIIHSFSDNTIVLKLMEMGCIPGEKITVDTKAPLGDPISVKVSGYVLSLRLNEAANIFVECK